MILQYRTFYIELKQVKRKLPNVSRYQEERSKKQLKDFRKAMAGLSIQDLLQVG